MHRFLLILSLLLFLGLEALFAQTKVITGKVIGDDGEPIPGASVVIKGTSTGVVTDMDGAYSLQVPADATALQISFIGMKMQELAIGANTSLNATLESDAINIDEVVVTALGISKQKKSLGYSVQNINSEELNSSTEKDVINSLASKAAGVQIISSGGVPGASSKILIRGNSSFTGNNQPLIVVDGVPIDNSTDATVAGDYPYNSNLSGVNNSNRAIDINPEDIESVSILKGASAAALYGARAANGAILYTTKRGQAGAPKIVYGYSMDFDQVSQLPEQQTKYAQGQGGTYMPGTSPQSWGPEISSIPGLNVYNNADDFFQTGVTKNHNLSVTGGSETNTYLLSIGSLNQEGVVPNSDFERVSARLNVDSKITDKLKVGTSFNYTNSGGTRVQNGSNTSGVMLSLLRAPSSWNLADYQNTDGSNKNYFSAYDNPYWSTENNPYTDDVDRVIGNIMANYEILPWLNATYKLGLDVYSDQRKQIFAIGSNGGSSLGTGEIQENVLRTQQYYQDFMVNASRNWFTDLNTTLTLGGNLTQNYSSSLFARGTGLSIPEFYNMSNATAKYADQSEQTIRTSAAFFDLGVSWKNYLYLTATGRNEWSSTFGSEQNNFFYPSVSGSFIFSEFVPENEILSYGKIRAARATVGSSPSAYTSNTYYTTPSFADGNTDGNSFPFLGQNGFTYSNQFGNPGLKPEQTVELELGVDVKFYNNRLGFELTLYDRKTTDILVTRPVAGSSGFQGKVANSGSMKNSGIELLLNATPVQMKGFSWDISATFTKNESEVLELSEGVSEIDIESAFQSIGSYAIVGQPYGALYGTKWERSADGQLLIGADGLPLVAAERGNIGNPFPDWTAGLRNSFRYKGFTLSALLDIREGGDVWCGTVARMNRFGISEESANREQTYVIPGVKADGTANTTPVSALNYFSHYKGDGSKSATENAVFDGSWIRLRDVSLSYRKDTKKYVKWLNFVEASISARNLWLSTDYPGVDPETSLTGAGSNLTGFDYFNSPGTKSYSFGVKFGIF